MFATPAPTHRFIVRLKNRSGICSVTGHKGVKMRKATTEKKVGRKPLFVTVAAQLAGWMDFVALLQQSVCGI